MGKSIAQLRAEQAAVKEAQLPAWVEEICAELKVKVVAVRPSGSKVVAKSEGA